MDTATVEQTAEGVNQEAAPVETSPVSEVIDSEVAPEEVSDDKLPFGKHPRWQKMLSHNKELSSKIKEFESRDSKYSQLLAFDKALSDIASNDSTRFQQIVQLIRGEEAKQQNDPYAEFDPLVAEKLRKVDQIDSTITKYQLESNRQAIDSHFNSLLTKEGYIKDGKPTDGEAIGKIEELVAYAINGMTNNQPERATPQQVENAFQNVQALISVGKRLGLKQTIKQDNVPPTGSRSRALALNPNINTEEGRLMEIEAILRGQ